METPKTKTNAPVEVSAPTGAFEFWHKCVECPQRKLPIFNFITNLNRTRLKFAPDDTGGLLSCQ